MNKTAYFKLPAVNPKNEMAETLSPPSGHIIAALDRFFRRSVDDLDFIGRFSVHIAAHGATL